MDKFLCSNDFNYWILPNFLCASFNHIFLYNSSAFDMFFSFPFLSGTTILATLQFPLQNWTTSIFGKKHKRCNSSSLLVFHMSKYVFKELGELDESNKFAKELQNLYWVSLQINCICPYILFAYDKIKKKGTGLSNLNNSTPPNLFLFYFLLCTFFLTMVSKIDAVQFCNGNCSVVKVIVPQRKGKTRTHQKHQ